MNIVLLDMNRIFVGYVFQTTERQLPCACVLCIMSSVMNKSMGISNHLQKDNGPFI